VLASLDHPIHRLLRYGSDMTSMIPLNRKIEQHATWKIGFGSVVAVTVVLVAVVVLV
tara:strand:- start:353 stop:523 length:171 start_codon:yes stop_codon:yes gene_type:complete